MKKSITLSFLIFISLNILHSQVTGVKYIMKSDYFTNTYDVYIKITEGSATTVQHRIQYNSQMTIVTPKDIDNLIVTNFLPLQNNSNYNSNKPMPWIANLLVQSPAVDPEHNYFTISPTLSPTPSYNNIAVGDEIKIFSFKIKDAVCYDQIRFYKNGVDPNNMLGADFSNGISLGGTAEDFKGIESGMDKIVTNNTMCENTEIDIPFSSSPFGSWSISDPSKLKIQNNKFIPLESGNTQLQYKYKDNDVECISPMYDISIVDAPYIFLSENKLVASESQGTFKWYDCSTNDLLKESTGSFFTPNSAGSYYAEINTGVCNVKTDCIDFILSGIDNKKLTGFIYPSITSGKIYTEMNEGKYNFEIFDMDGRSYYKTVHQQKSDRESIDLSFLKTGLYLLKFGGKEILSQKVIVSK